MAQQRIDKWLWFARIFKTRSLAAKFVSTGDIRLSRPLQMSLPDTQGEDKTSQNFDGIDHSQSQRIDKPKTLVKAGDVLSFMHQNRVRILEIVDCGKRRGPAPEAQRLYHDHSPPPPTKQEKDMNGIPVRDIGSGRPTKKERRAMEAWKNKEV